MKYKVATYIRIYKNDQNYYLQSKFKEGKEFIINESIFDFIRCFTDYNTFDKVLNLYELKLSTRKSELREILLKFFNDLILEKVLIAKNEQESSVKEKFTKKVDEFIEKYKISKTVASSNNLEVYKVNYNNKYFILKGYFKSKFTYEKNFDLFTSKLEKESRILETFKSTNINKKEDFIKNENYCFIVLEYIDGLNLYKYLIEKDSVESENSEIIYSILNIFSNIHQKGIIHGDIHFGNILFEESKAVIIDFGLSNYISDKSFNNGGFPIFMPPERIGSDFLNKFIKPSDFQSDVYQIGVLIYFVLTRKSPFISTNWKDLVKEKNNFKLDNIPEINRFYSIISKCLEKDLNKRYRNIIEIKNDLM